MSNPTIQQGAIWRRQAEPGRGDLHTVTGMIQTEGKPLEVATWGAHYPEKHEHGGYTFLGDVEAFLREFTYVSPGTQPQP